MGPELHYPMTFEAAEGTRGLSVDIDLLEPTSWRKVKSLGEAIFGKVYLAQAAPELQKKYPGLPEIFALKQMPREAVLAGRAGIESARNELCAARYLQKMDLPCVAPVYFVAQGLGKGKHEGRPCFFLATEYCELGELFAHLDRLGSIHCENAMREIMWQLLDALAGLHEAGIAHRDVSLENLLVNSCGNVRLIDFAQALVVHNGDASQEVPVVPTASGQPGKMHYRAPEVRGSKPYLATKQDIFACGVLLYTLAVGTYPSPEQLFTPEAVLEQRCKSLGPVLQAKQLQDRVKPAMLDLLEQLLAPDPTARITATEALAHPWLKGIIDDSCLLDAQTEDCIMEDCSAGLVE